MYLVFKPRLYFVLRRVKQEKKINEILPFLKKIINRNDGTIRVWDIRRASSCLMSLDQDNTGKEDD